jgi:hypothetical protein
MVLVKVGFILIKKINFDDIDISKEKVEKILQLRERMYEEIKPIIDRIEMEIIQLIKDPKYKSHRKEH